MIRSMPAAASRLMVLLLLAAGLAGPAQAQVKRYAALFGDPCCGIDDRHFKYMDANSACTSEVREGTPLACHQVQPGTLRSGAGPQPAGHSACIYTWNCTCGDCLIGEPSDPRNFNKLGGTGVNIYGSPAPDCPSGLKLDFLDCTKNKGKSKGSCPAKESDTVVSNPCNIASGNKYQAETVYRPAAGPELVLWYNSAPGVHYYAAGAFGAQWTSRYFLRVHDTGQGIVAVNRPDGGELEFRAPASGNFYLRDDDVNETLERLVDAGGATAGWRVVDGRTDDVAQFDAAGKLTALRDRAGRQITMSYSTDLTPATVAPEPGLLVAVTDHFGRRIGFTYNAKKRVAKLIDQAGAETLFEYDGPTGPAEAKNLTRVVFPDLKARVYHYSEASNINGGAACTTASRALPNALTGITDENGVRFGTWTYGCDGLVTGSEHAGGVEKYTFSYTSPRTYVDPLGTSRSMAVSSAQAVERNAGVTQIAAGGSGTVSTSTTYDANGNLASRTDFNGNRTDYAYDPARNLETMRTEGLAAAGAATAQTRTISTQWHPTFRMPAQIAEPLRITTSTYDADGTACGARGALCSKTIQATADASGSQGFSATPRGAPRVWTYTYNANGSVLTVDGPRTDVADVTTYTYYANEDADPGKRGNVATVTNAAGHVTRITAYNAHGQPLATVDPNGLTTTLAYDARQRLESRTVGGETTSYGYDGVGQLTRVTLPDGSYLSYTYDPAHRLTALSDNLGNQITYTLDAMGNRTAEQVRDPANALVQARSREFNSLNRLFRELGAQGQATEYAYDDQGNVVSVRDPLDRVTANQYDALNRLKQVTDPGLGVTQYGYNGLNALTSVSDPRALVTGYTVDGLGNLTQQVSPDTGTITSTHDPAGNLLTQTDAKGQVTAYAYDALNRVTQIVFHDGSKQVYAYDAGTNGIGRLAAITERNPANAITHQTSYAYDVQGRVLTIGTAHAGAAYNLAYSYDSAGRLAGMTYPSGRALAYSFDALGRVSGISTTFDGQTRPLVASVAYHPFGGVKSYVLGNGQAYARSIDADGRISSYTLGSQTFGIAYDLAGRIESISEASSLTNRNDYVHDALDRLTSASTPGTHYGYTYDAVGNRTSKTVGSVTELYTYSATSNRIATVGARSFVFDANGSTTNDGNNTYAYDTRGRMVQATGVIGTTSYQVNALGQRVRKTNSLGDTVFHYDTGGRLIAETHAGGGLKREVFYLGDIPVAVLQ